MELLIAARRHGQLDLGSLLALLGELDARGLMPLALRCLIQLAIDAEVKGREKGNRPWGLA